MNNIKDKAVIERSFVSKILPLLVTVFVILFIITVIVFYLHQKRDLKEDVSLKIYSSQKILKDDIEKDTKLLKGLVEPIINNKKFEPALINKDREMLKQIGLPIFYHLATDYNITDFTLIDIECRTIIRYHDINLFGEKVDRYTCQEAKKTGKAFNGLELGTLGTFTLRLVLPWYLNNKLIGYIELGMDIGHIVQRIKNTLEVEPYVFIDKRFLIKDNWEKGMKMLGFVGNWNILDDYVINNASHIPEGIIKIFHSDDFKKENIYLLQSSMSNRYNIGLFPLIDASGKVVGIMAITDDYTSKIKEDIKSYSLAIIISMAVVLLIIWFFNKVLKKIDKKLREHEQERDIYETKLLEAKEEAKASDRAKTEFLSNMSHEIRTPLNGILGTIELLLDTTLSNEQCELLTIAANSAEGLQLLMDSILNIADITSGRVSALKKKFNLRNMINILTKPLLIRAGQKGLTLSYKIMDDVPDMLFSFPELIKQALSHLIDNAIKFTDKGTIQLIIKKDTEGQLIFSVIDSGIGIPANKFDDIFKSFVQIDMTYTRKFGGAGLGLAITQKIINILGGRIWVESEIGHGSKFYFSISGYSNLDSVNDNPIIGSGGLLKNMSILIVDNDIINLAILKEILISEGAYIFEASCEAEAINVINQRRLEGNSFDTVIMEIGLHDIEISKFVEILKEDDTRIIFMGTDDVRDLKNWDKSTYLKKPLNKAMLINTLIKPLHNFSPL